MFILVETTPAREGWEHEGCIIGRTWVYANESDAITMQSRQQAAYPDSEYTIRESSN